MNDRSDAREQLEALLESAMTAKPAASLDRRIDALFHRRWTRHLSQVSSFAAGVVLTALILVPQIVRAPAPPASVAVHQSAPPDPPQDQPPAEAFVAQPHETFDVMSALLDGIPVRVETSHSELTLYRPGEKSGNPAGRIIFPANFTITPATPD